MHCDLRRLFTPFFHLRLSIYSKFLFTEFAGRKGRMYKRFSKIVPIITRNADVLTLTFVLLLGYLMGTFLAAETPFSFYALMRSAANSPVSIVGSLVSAYLPFLLAFAAVHYGKPALLYFILFCKAVVFSHCSMICHLAFGSGGWLIRLLLQFSDILLLPVLCHFAILCLRQPRTLRRSDIFIYSGAAALVAIINFCFISPYLAMLIDT